MKVFELVMAAILAAGGVRSIVWWSRRRIDASAVSHHVLYAAFLTGRIGMWFALAGFFLLYAFVEEVQLVRWYVMVPIVLAVLSLVSSLMLARSAD